MALSTKAQLAAMRLARGDTQAQAAAAAGVAERTIRNWLAAGGEFTAEVGRYKGLIVSEALDTLRAGLTEAGAELRTLVRDADPRVRLRASKELIAGYINLHNLHTLEERVRALEEQASASSRPSYPGT